MLQPAVLLRLCAEFVMLLLGLLLVQLAVTGRALADRRSPVWLALAVFLIYWGFRAWVRAGRGRPRQEERLRGGSLALVGAVMLGVVRAPFSWVAPLLGVAGGILALRGLLSIWILARAR